MNEDEEVLFIEGCKHFDLVVQRNEGIRWVTCIVCGADFVRSEFYEDMKADRDRLADAIRTHRKDIRHRDQAHYGGPIHRGTQAQAVNERLWAALDRESSDE